MSSKLETAIIVIIGIIAVVLMILNTNNSLDSRLCDIRGGVWIDFGGGCRLSPADHNQICYENSDCVTDCVYQGEGSSGYLIGRCSSSTAQCNVQIIPERTRSVDDLTRRDCSNPQPTGIPLEIQQKPESNLNPRF